METAPLSSPPSPPLVVRELGPGYPFFSTASPSSLMISPPGAPWPPPPLRATTRHSGASTNQRSLYRTAKRQRRHPERRMAMAPPFGDPALRTSSPPPAPPPLLVAGSPVPDLLWCCRQQQYDGARTRLAAFPHEAVPRPVLVSTPTPGWSSSSSSPPTVSPSLYHESALGVLCAADWTGSTTHTAPTTAQPPTEASSTLTSLLILFRHVLEACPGAVRCSYDPTSPWDPILPDTNPLRVALTNPTVPTTVIECLLEADRRVQQHQLRESSPNTDPDHGQVEGPHALSGTAVPAWAQTDRNFKSALDYMMDYIMSSRYDDGDDDDDDYSDWMADLKPWSSSPSSAFSPPSTSRPKSNCVLTVALEKLRILASAMAAYTPNDPHLNRVLDCNPLLRWYKESRSGGRSATYRSSTATFSPGPGRCGMVYHDNTGQQEQRLVACTEILLDLHPSLLQRTSLFSECSLLHAALGHHGQVSSLIRILLRRIEETGQGALLLHLNRFGQWPLHVACSSGVDDEILDLLLRQTTEAARAEASSRRESDSDVELPGAGAAYPGLWRPDVWGYSPVDLVWIHHTSNSNLILPRPYGTGQDPNASYPNSDVYRFTIKQMVDQIMHEEEDDDDNDDSSEAHDMWGHERWPPPSPARDSLPERGAAFHPKGQWHRSLLRRSIDQIHAGESSRCPKPDPFALLLHRTLLIVRAVMTDRFPTSEAPSDLTRFIVHRISALMMPNGPALPLPVAQLILSLYPEQLDQPDHQGRLPIHHAVHGSPGHNGMKFHKATVEAWCTWVDLLVHKMPRSCQQVDRWGRLPLHYALVAGTLETSSTDGSCTAHERVVQNLVKNAPESVEIRDPITRLPPVLLAATNPRASLNTIYFLLRRAPRAIN